MLLSHSNCRSETIGAFRTFEKACPVRSPSVRQSWARERNFCQICGISGGLAAMHRWPGLETHHLIKTGRSDEGTNFLRLCSRDHRLAEGHQIRENGIVLPKLTLGNCLWAKSLRDPKEFDPVRLEKLYHRPLPDLEVIPEFFLLEWQRHQGFAFDQSFAA